ncbi:MAG TPA: ECF transporter S component [Candidatus Lokiarchaeia archaeon]|nr:ECF transporter S component [Candidatus Lokiarchaeia archaeon]
MNPHREKPLNPLLIAVTAAFTALVFVATFSFRIPLPISGGYFNLGDVVIFVTALSFGPWIGAFAGGVGSMLSDMIGYPIYAPWTLIIKGMEGLIVGLLYMKFNQKATQFKTATVKETVSLLVFGFISSGSIVIFGMTFYSGELVIWVVFSIIMLLAIIVAVYYVKVDLYKITISILAGMFVMVVGYFLAEWFILFDTGALSEIPANILQCLVGLYLAIPIYQALFKSKILEMVSIYPRKREKTV